jgi:predicted ATPase
MADIGEIHRNVLAFLIDWKAKRDPNLIFTLRKRPLDRLQKGYWFLGNENYLAFSFWTGLDWVNKTQNIYVEISVDGTFRVRFSAKDDEDKAAVLKYAASVLGGFSKSTAKNYFGNIWTKQFPEANYLANLQLFLEDDKPRIDLLLDKERQGPNAPAFAHALNPLDVNQYAEAIQKIDQFRHTKPRIVQREIELISMRVKNVGLFEECSVSFGKRATALIGENGSGKTTLLRAIALGMAGTGSPLIESDGYELQTLPRIMQVQNDATIKYAGNGSIQIEYLFDEQNFLNGKANLISFSTPDDSGKIRFDDRIENEGFGLPLDESDGDGKLPYLLVGYPQRYGDNKDPINLKRRSPEANAYDILPLILYTKDNRLSSLRKWISENWNEGDRAKAKVNGLFAMISQVMSMDDGNPFSLTIISAPSADKIILATPMNPDGMLFDLLSTGLSNLFGWIGHLISRMYEAYPLAEEALSEPAIVFIDEIDNYLHPEVQVKLMKILLDSFPKTQFIFTAHSPFILSSLPSKEAKAYRIEDGKAVPIRHFYGQSIQNISYDQFGIRKRPPEIQSKIDEMTYAFAIENLPYAKELFAELRPILGDDDPAILDAMLDLEESERLHAPN